MAHVSWSAHNKAGLFPPCSRLYCFQDSSPRWLSPSLIKWRRLIKIPLSLSEARIFTSRKQKSSLLDSLESSPCSRIEGNTEEWSWGGRGSEHHQHLFTNDPTSQLLFHLLALLDLLMNSNADSYLIEVRSLGRSFFSGRREIGS